MLTGKHLIAGEWLGGKDSFMSSPATGDAHRFSVGTPADVDAAVQAAERDFPAYSALPREMRAQFLEEIAAQIDARGDAITAHGTAETGLPEARLIGERGREVREFIEHELGEEGRRKAVIVCATSDKSSMERAKAAYVATAIAEYFRDQGKKVLFLMDAVTRFARAQREIGLAAGEPPTRRGYPPSVFATLPKLMERVGMNDKGSITALYTVLVEGDDMTEPIADETRSILDGHIVLSRALASANHYPAIDVLASASRVQNNVIEPAHKKAAGRMRELMAKYADIELLVKIGEYKAGTDKLADEAISKIDTIRSFLKQGTKERIEFDETIGKLGEITGVR